jgi:phosphoribosylformylglycinamidine cyclo-ligase
MENEPKSYRRAGVSLSAQEEMNRIAVEASRWSLERLGLRADGLGGYAATLQLKGPGDGGLTLHMDGVGTKTLVLEKTGALWVAGWDCVAMNTNDLAVAGHRPLAVADYIAMPRPMVDAFREIVWGAARAAVESGAPLVAGETAILPGLAVGVDVVCAAVGLREYKPSKAMPGDLLVGVESNGLHANGYSLARMVVEERLGDYDTEYEGLHIGRELSKPTRIYVDLVMEAYGAGLARAAAHLTGGGWSKIKRILPQGAAARLPPPQPLPVFEALMKLGEIPLEEMYRVFNMGVGLVFATPPDRADELIALAKRRGHHAWPLGRVEETKGHTHIHLELGRTRITI